MQIRNGIRPIVAFTILVNLIFAVPTAGQPAATPARGRGSPGPQVSSPEVSADRRVTFRLLAPKAEAVRLAESDIPGNDFLVETSSATVAMFKKHGFDVVYRETEGGHTWINWREYLREFTPQLFK